MVKSVDEVIQRANDLVNTGWNYIYGAKYKRNPITKRYIDELARQNSQVFTTDYTNKAYKFIGKNAIDCSGLICYAYDMPDIGSWAIHDLIYTTEWFRVTEIKDGDILWRRGHVAIFNGGEIIEAKGINYGVKYSKYYPNDWTLIIRNASIHNKYEHTGWIMEPDGTFWFAYDNKYGSYYKNQIVEIDGAMYAFDSNGYLLSVYEVTTNEKGGFDGSTTITGVRYK